MRRRRATGRGALVGLVGLSAIAACIEVPERHDPESDADLRPADARPTGIDFDPLPGDAGPDLAVLMRDRGLPPRDRGLPPRDRGSPSDGPPPDMPPAPCPGGGELTEGLPVCLRVEPCAALPAARAEHAVALIGSGRVLLAGGTGGRLDGDDLDPATWLYDAQVDAWTPVGRFSGDGKGLHGHTLTALPDGRAVLVGGQQGDGFGEDARDGTYLFDPRMPLDGGGGGRGLWRDDNDTDDRTRHAAVWDVDAGELFVSGGIWLENANNDGHLRQGDGWSPPAVDNPGAEGNWANRSDASPRLFGHRLVRWTDGSLVRFGGTYFAGNARQANLQATRRVGGDWLPVPGNATLVGGAAVPTPAGILLVAGMDPDAPTADLRRLELPEGPVRVLSPMRVARRAMAAARLGVESMAVIVGGQEIGGDRLVLEVVDVADGQQGWLDVDLGWQGVWTGAGAVQLSDGDAIFVGGRVDGVPTARCLRVGLGD